MKKVVIAFIAMISLPLALSGASVAHAWSSTSPLPVCTDTLPSDAISNINTQSGLNLNVSNGSTLEMLRINGAGDHILYLFHDESSHLKLNDQYNSGTLNLVSGTNTSYISYDLAQKTLGANTTWGANSVMSIYDNAACGYGMHNVDNSSSLSLPDIGGNSNSAPISKPYTTVNKLLFGSDKFSDDTLKTHDVSNSEWQGLIKQAKDLSGDEIQSAYHDLMGHVAAGRGYAVFQKDKDNPNDFSDGSQALYCSDGVETWCGGHSVQVVTWDDSADIPYMDGNGIHFNNACVMTVAVNALFPRVNGMGESQAGQQGHGFTCHPSVQFNNGLFFMTAQQINYAPGYDAFVPPNQPPASTVNGKTQMSPAWYISSIVDNKISVHDKNFNTFDTPPFTCIGGTAPVLHYEIWQKTTPEAKITSGVQSATVEITYDFGKSNDTRDYEIIGWYDCGANNLEFNGQGRADFTIDNNGNMGVSLFANCVKSEFPFMDFVGCVGSIKAVTGLLSVGRFVFPSFTADITCTPMGTLGAWIHLPNQTLCPAFPAGVRDVVTPFVAFMLGIVTLGFLRRRNA